MFDVRTSGRVAEVRLARPPINVFRLADWAALAELIARIEADPDIDALVFHGGTSRAFSAGNDYREFPGITRSLLDTSTASIRDGLRCLEQSSLISIAAIHGACVGSAFLLACCCDIRIAAPDAVFSLPEVKVGAIGGYQIVRSLLPMGEARLMAFAGTPLSAERALQLGLVQEITDQPLAERGRAIASAMSEHLKAEHRHAARRMLTESDRAGLWDAHERERQHILDYMTDR
jgi:enoyl-CoA hydratase/carnithine racemase